MLAGMTVRKLATTHPNLPPTGELDLFGKLTPRETR